MADTLQWNVYVRTGDPQKLFFFKNEKKIYLVTEFLRSLFTYFDADQKRRTEMHLGFIYEPQNL